MDRIVGAMALALGIGTLLPSSAYAQEVVEVFRLGNQTVTSFKNTTVYVVDAMRDYTTRLSADLPKTPAEAQRVTQARFNALTAHDKEVIRQASSALVRAAEYKIAKTPAIVFDGKAVVYGVADVEQARAIYRGWRARGG
jgi:integrating conjugative element protein (TIGR03757 family)